MSLSDFHAEVVGLLDVLPTVRQSRGVLRRGLASDPLQELATSLFRVSRSRLGADSCQLLRNDGRGFFLLFSEPEVDSAFYRSTLNSGLARNAAQTLAIGIAPNVQKERLYLKTVEATRSEIDIPLVVEIDREPHALVVLSIQSGVVGKYDESVRDLARMLQNAGSTLLSNAVLEEHELATVAGLRELALIAGGTQHGVAFGKAIRELLQPTFRWFPYDHLEVALPIEFEPARPLRDQPDATLEIVFSTEPDYLNKRPKLADCAAREVLWAEDPQTRYWADFKQNAPPVYCPLSSGFQPRSEMIVPIGDPTRPVGIINVESEKAGAFDSRFAHFVLERAASYLGPVLSVVRAHHDLSAQERVRSARQEVINRHMMYGAVTHAIGNSAVPAKLLVDNLKRKISSGVQGLTTDGIVADLGIISASLAAAFEEFKYLNISFKNAGPRNVSLAIRDVLALRSIGGDLKALRISCAIERGTLPLDACVACAGFEVVLHDIITNAIRALGENDLRLGRQMVIKLALEIDAVSTDSIVIIECNNNGPAFPTSDASRDGKAPSNQTSGMNYALSAARLTMQLAGGGLRITSPLVDGRGTSVRVWLPYWCD